MPPLRAVPLLKSREEQDAVILVCLVICVCSGMINAGVYYGVGELVTHVTGTVMHVGRLSATQLSPDGERLHMMCGLLGSYVSGSLLAGICMGRERWRNLMVATMLLFASSFLIMGAAALLSMHSFSGVYLACMGSGLHNALSTRVTGFVRTSHSTGTLTDIGLVLGEALMDAEARKDWMTWRRLGILFALLISFIFVAAIMTATCEAVGIRALWLPAGILCFLASCGAVYILHEYLLIREHILKEQEEGSKHGTRMAKREPSTSPEAATSGLDHAAWEALQRVEREHVDASLEVAEGMPSIALGVLDSEETLASHIHLHHVDSTIIGHSASHCGLSQMVELGEVDEPPSLQEKRESMRRASSSSLVGTPYLAI